MYRRSAPTASSIGAEGNDEAVALPPIAPFPRKAALFGLRPTPPETHPKTIPPSGWVGARQTPSGCGIRAPARPDSAPFKSGRSRVDGCPVRRSGWVPVTAAETSACTRNRVRSTKPGQAFLHRPIARGLRRSSPASSVQPRRPRRPPRAGRRCLLRRRHGEEGLRRTRLYRRRPLRSERRPTAPAGC
jgi:hypothetical protein